MTSPPDRVAVIGDVGGHVAVLRAELVRLGADPDTGRIPEHLVIVQLGDLVHRGPDSAAVVDLVDVMLRGGQGRWVQLLGNHEAHYVADRVFEWPEELPAAAADRLRAWWSDGSMVVAAAFRAPSGDFLVTHAGLTAGFWRSVLDTPVTAAQTAARLNAWAGRTAGALFRTGSMINRKRPSIAAGPLWAEAGRELVPSWFETRIIHITSADPQTRHEVSRLGGGAIIGVDPCHGQEAAPVSAAWVSDRIGAVVTRPDRKSVV